MYHRILIDEFGRWSYHSWKLLYPSLENSSLSTRKTAYITLSRDPRSMQMPYSKKKKIKWKTKRTSWSCLKAHLLLSRQLAVLFVRCYWRRIYTNSASLYLTLRRKWLTFSLAKTLAKSHWGNKTQRRKLIGNIAFR